MSALSEGLLCTAPLPGGDCKCAMFYACSNDAGSSLVREGGNNHIIRRCDDVDRADFGAEDRSISARRRSTL